MKNLFCNEEGFENNKGSVAAAPEWADDDADDQWREEDEEVNHVGFTAYSNARQIARFAQQTSAHLLGRKWATCHSTRAK